VTALVEFVLVVADLIGDWLVRVITGDDDK
jgi:hypothetical protein